MRDHQSNVNNYRRQWSNSRVAGSIPWCGANREISKQSKNKSNAGFIKFFYLADGFTSRFLQQNSWVVATLMKRLKNGQTNWPIAKNHCCCLTDSRIIFVESKNKLLDASSSLEWEHNQSLSVDFLSPFFALKIRVKEQTRLFGNPGPEATNNNN